MERFLGDEVYHYHSKLVAKDPRVGGGFEWHQDYGYWYHNACLFPDMGACIIAIDHADRENGCLEVLRGSHRMGRIDHVPLGTQVMADPDRVGEAVKRLPSDLIEMAPGDGLFFHCNLLHRSAPNRSGRRRWVLIAAYNAKGNDPYKDTYLPRYKPLAKVEDDAIRTTGRKGASADKSFVRSPQGVGPKSENRTSSSRV
jgi:ectoine hydroxylase-related dioxygenase (phytanoyl-CoA dioxygenase family)